MAEAAPLNDNPDPNRLQLISTALSRLVQQIDVGVYRDAKGHNLHNNIAYMQAQELVDRFGLSHERICCALDECDGDPNLAAHRLVA